MGASHLPKTRDVGFSAPGNYCSPQDYLGSVRTGGRLEGIKCKKLRIFINSTPRVGRGGYQTWIKLHQGNSSWVLLRQGLCSADPQPLCPVGQAVPNRGPVDGLQEPLLAMAVGCRLLLIQVEWDPSLIFDFNKLVRIYFFVYVLFQLM